VKLQDDCETPHCSMSGFIFYLHISTQ